MCVRVRACVCVCVCVCVCESTLLCRYAEAKALGERVNTSRTAISELALPAVDWSVGKPHPSLCRQAQDSVGALSDLQRSGRYACYDVWTVRVGVASPRLAVRC